MITNNKLVFWLKDKMTRNQVIKSISQKLVDEGYATNVKKVYDGFTAREKESTTGLSDGIAIPHVSSDAIKETKIIVARLRNKTDWKALDGKPTDFVIAIAVPKSGRNEHFDLLTKISSSLASPEFIKKLKSMSNKDVVNFLNNINKSEQQEEINITTKITNNKEVNIVGVTTCVTGVAHTFLAAQALEDEGNARGYNIKIERQGQMTKNILTQEEIDNADYVIIAQSKSIEGQERFDGKKLLSVEVAEPITKAGKVLDRLLQEATIQSSNSGSKGSSTVSSVGPKQKSNPMQHLMAGISYMIPYIAMAGIVLGLTTAFGFKYFEETGTGNWNGQTGFVSVSPFAEAFSSLAGAAFTLYIPILAMFIANSIAGRKAMAPAAILGLVLNIAPILVTGEAGDTPYAFAPFFNWGSLSFDGWWEISDVTGDPTTISPALGFLGAVAAGYMVGYGVKYFTMQTDKIESQVFQSVVPLLIIPILFTTIPWLFMAFIGYLPLFYFSRLMYLIVNSLIDINMFWLAGGLMGAMICFDLGGPVNKVAMAIGVMMISGLSAGTDDAAQAAVLNGVAAVAVSIPAAVLLFTLIFNKITPIKMDKQDETAAGSAALMGFFGITEGAIPFAAKEPKKWMPSFMIAGFVGGALASTTGVVDNVAMWGGPIIYIAGGFGSIYNDVGGGMAAAAQTANWTWTLLYFIPLIIGGLVGFATANVLEVVYGIQARKAEKTNIPNEAQKQNEIKVK